MLVVSDHIMKFGRERAAGKLHRPGEVAQDRLHAAVSPRTSSSFGWVLLPASAGVAILRYRLYDIDRLINRTLVYGLLTASLGLGYAGAVLVLGHLFGGIRGEPPSWVVAGATLAVAALFQPARRRIQSIVDRRFNRRKIRRRQDGQGVQRPAPRPAGPGHALDRAPGGRRRDGPAGQGLDMASATVPGGFAQPRTSKLARACLPSDHLQPAGLGRRPPQVNSVRAAHRPSLTDRRRLQLSRRVRHHPDDHGIVGKSPEGS